MAGALTISTLNNDTGVLATQNGMTGIAKAWVNFDGTGTVAIRSSFNVSSITDNGVGDYTVNFTTAMPNANYVIAGVAGGVNAGGDIESADQVTARTTSLVRIYTVNNNGTSLIDCPQVNVVVFSS